jgi:PIN domain nuclease of toxin-antitoxin system
VRILLDTHAFLWAITDDRRLSRQARKILQTADLFLSVVSFWEIVTKVQIGKLPLPDSPSKYLPRHVAALGAEVLPIEAAHVLRLESLPLHHRDPFDRLLIAQSLEEKLPLLSCDTLLAPYGADIRWE